MLITKMRSRECREMLTRLGYGRLACASNNRPYIVPLYFSYDADRLCCFSTVGRKIEWMRANPLVCVQVEEIRGHDEWTSIVVFGQYVEIPGGREFAKSRGQIRSLLQKRSLWWQSGYTASQIRRKQASDLRVLLHPHRGNYRPARDSRHQRECESSRDAHLEKLTFLSNPILNPTISLSVL